MKYLLRCGNCVDILNKQKEEWVDLVVTSPPYDNLRDYNGFTFNYQATIKAIYRCLKVGGVCVWIVADQTKDGSESGNSLRHGVYARQIGFNLHDTMIYCKRGLSYPGSLTRYYQGWEFMYVWSKGTPKSINLITDRKNISAGRIVTGTGRQVDGSTTPKSCLGNEIPEFGIRYNYWDMTSGKRDKLHPAAFYEEIPRDHIISWSNEGDIVLDPMTGSSTTGVAALKLGRKFVGIDISQEYIDISEERLKQVQLT
jgi:site-specific DNA-methyltransferase (adenine-specific)